MSWRPEGWKNPYFKSADFEGNLATWNEYPAFSIFEAGADAMLGALFQLAKESPTGIFTFDSNVINILGGKG